MVKDDGRGEERDWRRREVKKMRLEHSVVYWVTCRCSTTLRGRKVKRIELRPCPIFLWRTWIAWRRVVAARLRVPRCGSVFITSSADSMAQAMYALTSEFFINPFDLIQFRVSDNVRLPMWELNHSVKKRMWRLLREIGLKWVWEDDVNEVSFTEEKLLLSSESFGLFSHVFRTCLVRWICRILLLHFCK